LQTERELKNSVAVMKDSERECRERGRVLIQSGDESRQPVNALKKTEQALNETGSA
jgi:hypothetical protein